MTPERDRSDGRRAIFSAPGGAARPAGARPTRSRGEGRQALFSAPEEPPGVLAVECSGCGARTPVGLLELGRHLVPSLWLPFRRHPRLMRCPACGRAAWCRIAARRRGYDRATPTHTRSER